MADPLVDHADRERFRTELDRNFAVSANAGSGKTTAISSRLAALAQAPNAATLLAKTAVVTFTNKAASQIGQRARSVLLRELTEAGAADLHALDHLERAFFGTIHSFCLLLAQRYGQNLGIHLNPTVIAEDDEIWWEDFLEQDPMEFSLLEAPQLTAFLRHVPIEHVFGLARSLDVDTAHRLAQEKPMGLPPAPDAAVLREILAVPVKGTAPARKNMEVTQQAAREWFEQFASGTGFLPPFEPAGNAAAVVELTQRWTAPLKRWLGNAAAVLAAELALRYRAFRVDRGIQTYADQIEGAMAVLRDAATLDRIRAEGWRVILDEAQDTDAQQFAVLVEIARPVGAALGTWPTGGGAPPRPGHFSMVGDGQQAIYGARADIRNFLRHLDAFSRGDGGELLKFRVTFRSPRRVVAWLNEGFPAAFGQDRLHNLGLPPAENVVPPVLQVPYEPLEPAPVSADGAVSLFELTPPERPFTAVESWLVEEVTQLARYLSQAGPASIGADRWGDVTLLAPRNEWLNVARRVLEQHGLKVALQVRRQRQRDNPAFAWLCGLLSVVCDPDNAFEWFGVLREIFAIKDSLLATELRQRNGFHWDEPDVHPEPLREALQVLRPFILRVDDGGVPLMEFIEELAEACALRPKLQALDASGLQAEELERLIAVAAEFGRTGPGPRDWLRELLREREEGRPLGKKDPDAINLLTAHSAKGLEWPIVIPLGLWRRIGQPPEAGLRIVPLGDGRVQVYLDRGSVPVDTQEARDRERLRELVRLLYVTLTRVRRHLIIPWHPQFGGKQRSGASFAELWGTLELLEKLPRVGPAMPPVPCAAAVREMRSRGPIEFGLRAHVAPLPARVLPHEMGRKHDVIREARHEASAVEVGLAGGGEDDAIEYGLWWHETVEFMPWTESDDRITSYIAERLKRVAPIGFAARAEREVALLRSSAAWEEIRLPRWTRLAELAVFAPKDEAAWIDGVVDLAMHDAAAGELWIIDWKTNRVRAAETEHAFLDRLAAEYRLQLQAYGACLSELFPEARIRLWLYSSAVGQWRELPS